MEGSKAKCDFMISYKLFFNFKYLLIKWLLVLKKNVLTLKEDVVTFYVIVHR